MAQAPPAYVVLAGMDGMTPQMAQEWIETHLSPTQAQLTHLFDHVFVNLNQVLTTCWLSNRQEKYAVLHQSVQEIRDLKLLGSSVDDVCSIFKGFNNLTEVRGGVNFGVIHYTRVFALVSFTKDKKHHGQDIVAAEFLGKVISNYISKAEAKKKDDGAADLDLPTPPALADGNFYKWEQAVYTNLLSKIGTHGIPLTYIVQKDTIPKEFQSNMECLIYEVSRVGPGWDEDNKAVGIYIMSLLTGKLAETWIKKYIKVQDGKVMMVALHVHYLGQLRRKRS